MTQKNEQAKMIAELNALFLVLNEKEQESALNILRSLQFAQSVVFENYEKNLDKSSQDNTA